MAYTQTGGAYGQAQKLPCHTGPILCMKVGEVSIYGARARDVETDFEWDLRIRIQDSAYFNRAVDTAVRGSFGAAEILPHELFGVLPPPTLDIDWEDFSVPQLPPSWWETLMAWIKAQTEPANVVVYCMGGHGRTGTILSILLGLSGLLEDDEDPVGVLRNVYCSEAVESTVQIMYVEHITGCKVRQKAAGVSGWVTLKEADQSYNPDKDWEYEAKSYVKDYVKDWEYEAKSYVGDVNK